MLSENSGSGTHCTESTHSQGDSHAAEARRETAAPGTRHSAGPQHSAGGRPVDGDGEVSWLCVLALALDGQLRGLAEPWVGHLIIQHVHDGLELHIGHVLAIDRLDHPAVLHASDERLALRVTWVPALVHKLLGHSAPM